MKIFITRIKTLLRKKENIFWALVFPCILGMFFYLGFGKLSNDTIIDTIDIYVANDSSNQVLVGIMQEAMIDDDTLLFNVNLEYGKDTLEEKLIDEEIRDYIYVGETNEIIYRINESGLPQTIIKSFLDQYVQVSTFISTVDNDIRDEVIVDLNSNRVYFEDMEITTDSTANFLIIYFYSLLAVACMFANYWGLGLVNDIQADMSPLAARVNVAPTHKFKLIIIYFIAAFLIQYIGNILFILFLKYVLGVEFSHNILLILLASFVGSFGGIALGGFIASVFKSSYGKMVGIGTIVTLVMGFLSGLMVVNVKYFISKYIPILGYINPVSLLTDSYYSLYYYNDIGKYFFNIGILSIISIIMILVTYFKIRGKKYDSI